ncbi:MAG: ferric reductase-like transmembrane domain-containing protein [Terrimicrobiaceae bacterium]|nr:ferric reductase-like transmembrane domain-containing protein [Terrimicrobiaceae bacterium]
MEKASKIIGSRWFAWPLLTLPALLRLVIPALTDGLGFNPLQELLHRTGQIAVWTLAAVLCLTPLKTLFPKSRLAGALNRHRRTVGVAACVYAALHVTANFLYEGQFQSYLDGVWKPFLLSGTTGFLILLALAVTSNAWSVRHLGYRLWKWIHRLAYVAAVVLFYHQGTSGKGNWPAAQWIFFPLAGFEILRLGKSLADLCWRGIRRRRGAWSGWRDFEVLHREEESATITSFHLRPVDGRRLPPHQPGQFLTVEVTIPNEPRPLVRTYTISDSPNGRTYRLSIKREPRGVVSNYFHDSLAEGARLRARPPAGGFCLDPSAPGPIILLSAGVGITPMIAMLDALVASGRSRPVWFLHGARNRREHAFASHVRSLAARHAHVRAHIAYSQPEPGDEGSSAPASTGRVDMELVKKLLPSSEGEFYLCGPGAFMQSLHSGLIEWGVTPARIHYESFGPATVMANGAASPSGPRASRQVSVEFLPSGVQAAWDGGPANLLELALTRGLKPAYGCRAGVCGACSHRLIQGSVACVQEPAWPAEPGRVLLCSAFPVTDVQIDIAG